MYLRTKGLFTKALCLGLVGAAGPAWSGEKSNPYQQMDAFTEALEMARDYYVDEEASLQEKLVFGAIKGMLEQLDPYSGFLEPQGFEDMKVETKGKFGGLGIEIAVRRGVLTVVAPIEGTPADRVGLRAGDRIIRIEEESTDGITIMDAVHKLRGPKGTKVKITVARDGYGEPFEFSITRAIITIESVKWQMLDDDILYLRITEFMEQTSRDVEKALKDAHAEKLSGVVLDLRNNPGGLLSQAVEVADLFLSGGHTIVSTEGRVPQSNRVWKSRKKPGYLGPQLVLLVNQGSASGSEIVAGALKDLERGLLVGQKTFGKGSVQTIVPLRNIPEAAIRLTTAYYYTPSKIKIHEKGIEPNIALDRQDPQRETLRVSQVNAFQKFARYWLERPELKVKPREEQVEFNGEVFEALVDYLRDQGLRPDREKLAVDARLIGDLIQVELVRVLEGEIPARRKRVETDPWVLRGKELIRAMNLGDRT